jgi:hypothetical protein
MTKNVLVSNILGTKNTGDLFQAEILAKILDKCNVNYGATLWSPKHSTKWIKKHLINSYNFNECLKINGYQQILSKRYKQLRKENKKIVEIVDILTKQMLKNHKDFIKKYDAVVVIGGGYLIDFCTDMVIYNFILANVCDLLNIPILFMSHSIEVTKPDLQELIKLTSKNAIFTFRESSSMKLFLEYSNNKNTYLTSDLVTPILSKTNHTNRSKTGFIIRFPHGDAVKHIKKVLEKYSKKEVILIPSILREEHLKDMKDNFSGYKHVITSNLDKYIFTLNKCKEVYGIGYHPMVFPFFLEIPFTQIGSLPQPKHKGFLRDIRVQFKTPCRQNVQYNLDKTKNLNFCREKNIMKNRFKINLLLLNNILNINKTIKVNKILKMYEK